jgi:hypothetical protein
MHSPCGLHEYPAPTKRCALCARLMAELRELPTARRLTEHEKSELKRQRERIKKREVRRHERARVITYRPRAKK